MAKAKRKRNRFPSLRPSEMEVESIFSPPIRVYDHQPAIHHYVGGVIHAGCTCGWLSIHRSKIDPMRSWWLHARKETRGMTPNGAKPE